MFLQSQFCPLKNKSEQENSKYFSVALHVCVRACVRACVCAVFVWPRVQYSEGLDKHGKLTGTMMLRAVMKGRTHAQIHARRYAQCQTAFTRAVTRSVKPQIHACPYAQCQTAFTRAVTRSVKPQIHARHYAQCQTAGSRAPLRAVSNRRFTRAVTRSNKSQVHARRYAQ